jgi:uncharacterized protein
MRHSEVITKLKDHRNFLVEEFGVKALFLFGSVARDEASKDSDVDLFVEFNNPIGLFKFISLKHELETLLGCQVDLGTKRSLKREITELIEGETIRVAAKHSSSKGITEYEFRICSPAARIFWILLREKIWNPFSVIR